MSQKRLSKAILQSGTLSRFEDGQRCPYKPGDELLVSEEEIAFYGDRLKVEAAHEVKTIESPSQELATDEVTDEVVEETITPADHWTTAKKQVEGLSTAQQVEAFLAAEREGRARDSVIAAGEARLEELSS